MRHRDAADWLQAANTVAYALTIVVGVVGNLWVAWKVGLILLFDKSSSVPRQVLYCIFLICCADLLVLVDLLLLVHFRLTDQWVFDSFICKMFYCIEVINKLVIPLGLVQISRVSYRAVQLREPVSSCAERHCGALIFLFAIISVGSLMVCVIYFAETNTYVLNRRGGVEEITVCNFNPPQYYQSVFNLLAFVIGYVLTSVSYVYFYVKVPLLLYRGRQRSLSRVRRTVTVFVVVYLCCWTPYWVLFWVLSWLHGVKRWIVVLSSFTHLLPYVSCTAYPIVLTAMNDSIRKAHSSIMNSKRRQLTTIRRGALQAMSAQLGMFHSWLRDNGTKPVISKQFDTTFRPDDHVFETKYMSDEKEMPSSPVTDL